MDVTSIDHTPASLRVRRGLNTVSSMIRASAGIGAALSRQEIELVESGVESAPQEKVAAYAKTLCVRVSILVEAMRVARGERRTS